MTQIINTDGGNDFTSALVGITVDTNGNYVNTAVTNTFSGTVPFTVPGSTTANGIALWSNTSGTALKDSNLVYNGSNTLTHTTDNFNITAGDDYSVRLYSTATGGATFSELDLDADGATILYGGTAGNTKVQIAADDNITINADSTGTITLSASGINVVGPFSVDQSILVGAAGGLTSAGAGQEIALNASSGVSIGGGIGPIVLSTSSTTNIGGNDDITIGGSKQTLISTTTNFGITSTTMSGTIGTSTTFSANDTDGYDLQFANGGYGANLNLNGNETIINQGGPAGTSEIKLVAGTIATVGNFLPQTSGVGSVGMQSAPYASGVFASVITQSPNGAFWKLSVDNAGNLTVVSA